MMYKDAEMITGGVFDCQCNETFTLIRADQSLYRFLGYTQKEFSDIYQNQLFYAIHEEERSKILEEIGRQVQKDGVFMYENRLKCKDGILKWIWISAQLNKNECNEPYFHCIFHDITESKKIQEALLISEKRLQFILSQTQDVVFEYDCKTNEIYYSDNLEKKYGYKIPVKGFPDSMFASNIIHKDDILPLRNGFQSILHGKEEMSCEYRLKYRNKGYRWVYAQATGLRDDKNNIIKIIGVITDIHDQKQELLKSREEAALDPLTGLFNRRECIRRIENYIAVNDAPFAFILIDVDDFKMINDVYGHAKGDEALIRVGVEISSIIRKNDLTARIGGDEFVICLMNIPDRQIAINKVELIQDILVKVYVQSLAIKSTAVSVSAFILMMVMILKPCWSMPISLCTNLRKMAKTNFKSIRARVSKKHMPPIHKNICRRAFMIISLNMLCGFCWRTKIGSRR